ncbi:MAG: hypothetical protein C0460_12300 [Methylibium sp.]|jgi:hypothetical protein|nr:hypothetical protein [Methylibium sp.]|mmetsp:Transcript_12872/g.30275  ORF Transcript_12872/g.30275 Transcript_12872/m.30275 type:complete len:228 (+) Transcript_12872:3760-4443(+)
MKNHLIPLVGAALLTFGAQFAAAAEVTIAWQGNKALAGVALQAFDTTVSSSEPVFDDYALRLGYTNLSNNSSFAAFCIAPLKGNSVLPEQYTKSAFGGDQGAHLASLYQVAYRANMDATQQAAFQLAVWEFTQEVPNASGVISFGTRTGNFHVSAPDSVLNLADSYVSDALNFKGQSAFSVFKLNNATYQDLVTAEITSAVPEPETFALFLGGLGAIGLLARRRTVR